MSEGVLHLEDLESFFENGFSVTSQTDTEWVFAATSAEFAGYTVTLDGTGLTDTNSDSLPDTGIVNHILVFSRICR